MGFRISVDIGGTFTDGILLGEKGEMTTAKAHSTPRDPIIGTIDCLSKLSSLSGMMLSELLSQTRTIVLGTTLATNIVATRSGAKMGTITTKGYRDRITFLHVAKADLGGDRKATSAELFSFRSEYPKPLTHRYLMTDVEERVNYKGEVLIPLNEDDVRQAVRYLKGHGVESIAVMLLFSHLHPAHERRIGEIIKEEYPEAYVSLSSTVLPITGEVARWSTTMFSAYVAPKVIKYVSGTKGILEEKGFKGALVFMQSNGGVATADIICENPAALLVSGPAAGPSLGLGLTRLHKVNNVITADMGGTSFDVSVIPEGQINVTQKKVIDGKKYGLFTVDVNAIGAGGGSIAWIDASGRLQVGPQSAGASPGPACYGIGGTDPTVTDANVALGYIDPDYFLGGETKLRKDLAEKAIQEKIADPLGLSPVKAAAAIYDVINAKMAGAIDVVFSKRGYDPRDFTLCAAGGAAPVHAARLMEELGIKQFMVPKVAPVFCAFGMMYADLKHNFTRPLGCETAKANLDRINDLFREMEKEALETLRKEEIEKKDVLIERSMDIRYYGQVREQNASVPDGPFSSETLRVTIDRFHERHRKILGYSDTKYPTEIIRLHLTGIAKVRPPQPLKLSQGGQNPSKALKGKRRAFFNEFDDLIDVKVYDGDKFLAGNGVEGPSIIEEKMTTLVIPPGVKINVDLYGNYTTLMKG
jgi:N-methylhydantoinase A